MELSNIITLKPTTSDIRHYPSTTPAARDGAFPHPPFPAKNTSHIRGEGQPTLDMVSNHASRDAATAGAGAAASTTTNGSMSPQQSVAPKNVAFELLFPESPQYRARLPMRVQIFPHDTTESIVVTVQNFYGLFGPKCISFEDEQGNTLIARYENFRNNMVVYVRVTEDPNQASGAFGASGAFSAAAAPVSAQPYYSGDSHPQAPQQAAQNISRPASTTSRRRSPSPVGGRGRRSTSAGTNSVTGKKGRSRSSKARGTSSHQGDIHSDGVNGYSSGDNAPGSVSSRAKEQIGNTEISVENIVEGGRRKRANFESSELPLFAPPQMPAATSNPSVSPARRTDQHRPSLPFIHPGQNPFTNPRPLQSPQTYHSGYGQSGVYATPSSDHRRARGSIGYPSNPAGNGTGILPTPDPTVGSCMSEEDKDVAIQLMRLGDLSNISHGRTSASTLDDTFSGRADAASSTGATSNVDSDSEEELPPARKQRLDEIGSSRKIYQTTESHFILPHDGVEASGDDADYEDGRDDASGRGSVKTKAAKVKSIDTPSAGKPKMPPSAPKLKAAKAAKAPRPAPVPKVKKANSITNGPMSPNSLPASRKPSIASNATFPLAPGEDDQPDLSTKPRCQRCRKSKKGCDRQRPCGRCRDAGIPADQCISEDEGNGRKGRYGRHMGVPIKKEDAPAPPALLPAAPITTAIVPPNAPPSIMAVDKAKKRKR